MLGAFGVGAVGGAMLNARLRELCSSEMIVRLSFTGFAASAVVAALSTSTWLTCLVLLVPGACWVLALSLFNTTVQLSTPRWVVGDLHSHSEHSDGGVTVLDAMYRARAAGLDFVAITDHNTVSQNAIRPDDPGLLVIPAMELTSFYGHTNFFGLEKPVADWRCRSPQDVADKMAEARANGATIVINHPFQNSDGGRWQAGFDVNFDAYEIWNGNWSLMNEQGLAFWQELLCTGRKIPATGGSDFHLKNRRRHGCPANRLSVETRSIRGILEAVRKGRNVIAFSPHETMAVPAAAELPMFGASVAAGERIGVLFSGLVAGDEIRTVTENGVVATEPAATASLVLERRFEGRFVRFEVWYGDRPKLFTNPYYAE